MAQQEYVKAAGEFRGTPQSTPLPGREREMVRNAAGGFTFEVDQWQRLRRFLILGSDGGTYYVSPRRLTMQNAANVADCIKADGERVVREVVAVSTQARAPRQDPALFTLALALSPEAGADLRTRRAAAKAWPLVVRTGGHLMTAISYMKAARGTGRLARKVLQEWYLGKSAEDLAYQVMKYRSRAGWTHRDVLRIAHCAPPDGPTGAVLEFAVKGTVNESAPALLHGFDALRNATSPQEAARLIAQYGLPREAVPTEFLAAPQVWEALLYSGGKAGMPMQALLRNLGKMTAVGLIGPGSNAARYVAERLRDASYWSRDWETSTSKPPHPIAVLIALRVYQAGQGARGSLAWEPVAPVLDALDEAFYSSFGSVTPTGRKFLLALDVSGSMHWTQCAGTPVLSAREASAAMALLIARTEAEAPIIMGFSDEFIPLNISPRQRLDDALKAISDLPFGATDCSLPMRWAMKQEIADVDTFVVFTDNGTWAGEVHPVQALRRYREKYNGGARLAVAALSGTGNSIADPQDAGMMDMVGIDAAMPRILAAFARGEV